MRLARGFTSSTYTRPSLIAYCTLISPTTLSAFASATVCSRIVSTWSFSPIRYGGSTHAESPEWMPASSMCCITPPITTCSPSQMRVDVGLERILEEASR